MRAFFYNAKTGELFKVLPLSEGRTNLVNFANYCVLHAHNKPVTVELVNNDFEVINTIKF